MTHKKNLVFAILLVFTLSIAIFNYTNQNRLAKASVPPSWDFEDHTYDHMSLTNLSADQIINELTTMNSVFQAHGLPPPQHLSYPNGAYNNTVIDIVSSYRLSGRTTNSPKPENYPVPWYTLNAIDINSTTTFEKTKSWIDSAVSERGLLNLFTHDVQNQPNTYGTTPAILQQVLDYLVNQQTAENLTVMTMRQAYTDYTGQQAVVVLSFDDGSVTDYTNVWPMFTARGLAGTSYIIGSRIDHLDSTGLTWSMVDEMAQIQAAPNPTLTPTPSPIAPTGSTIIPPSSTPLPTITPQPTNFNQPSISPIPSAQIPEFLGTLIFSFMIGIAIIIMFLNKLFVKRKFSTKLGQLNYTSARLGFLR